MARPVTPWVFRAWELLGDGPRRYGDVLREMAKLVPPGQAVRRRSRELQRDHNRHGYKERIPKEVPLARQVEIGSKLVVQQSLNFHIKSGSFVTFQEGGEKWVERTDWTPRR